MPDDLERMGDGERRGISVALLADSPDTVAQTNNGAIVRSVSTPLQGIVEQSMGIALVGPESVIINWRRLPNSDVFVD